MIVNGFGDAKSELFSFAKTAGQAAGSAVLEKAGAKLRAGQAAAPGPSGPPDNTIRNVALAGGGIVVGIVLLTKLFGRKRASNPGGRRGASGCRRCSHWLT
jgi:hypothetical protein